MSVLVDLYTKDVAREVNLHPGLEVSTENGLRYPRSEEARIISS